MQKNLEHLYCLILSEHGAKVFLLILLLTGVSLWGLWGLQMDADFAALLDPSNQSVQDYQEVLDNFSGTDAFVLLIHGEKQPGETIENFLAQLATLPEITSIQVVDEMPGSARQGPGDSMLLLIKPTFKPTALSQSRLLSQALVSTARQFHLSSGLTGSYQVLIESADAANRDMLRAGLITLAGVMGLLLLIFSIPFIVVLCMAGVLCVGLCWTLALARAVAGDLNLLTATMPAVLLGLGVDYSLHILYAFHEKTTLLSPLEIGNRQPTQKAFLAYVFSQTYKPLWIGALTTAAAFAALCFARSRGLYQMGLMGVIGIGCTFITATGLLPILLNRLPLETLTKIRHTEGRWLCASQVLSSKSRLIVTIALLFLLGGLGAMRVRFGSDQNKLADQTLPAYVLQNQLQQEQGLSWVPIAFVSPDKETEQAKLFFLHNLPDSPFGLMESYTLTQLQNRAPDRFLGADGTYLILAYPRNNAFEPAVFERIASVAAQCEERFPGPGNRITGSPFLNAGLNRTIRADLVRCSALAGGLIFLLVFFSYRAVHKTLIAILPVVLGTVLMIGFMGFMKIDFTIMTIVIVPLVLGAGIDDGVHIVSRWHIENQNLLPTLRGVVTPVIGTTLTSMIGFGSLMFSDTPGFRQLGLVTMAGLAFCLLISLGILPQILNLFKRSQST